MDDRKVKKVVAKGLDQHEHVGGFLDHLLLHIELYFSRHPGVTFILAAVVSLPLAWSLVHFWGQEPLLAALSAGTMLLVLVLALLLARHFTRVATHLEDAYQSCARNVGRYHMWRNDPSTLYRQLGLEPDEQPFDIVPDKEEEKEEGAVLHRAKPPGPPDEQT